MPPDPLISLKWALDELLWSLILEFDDYEQNPDLQSVRIGKTVECLLPYTKRLVEVLNQVLTTELTVEWHSNERISVMEVSGLLKRIDSYLTSVYSWCVKLEDPKLCSHLKVLTLRTFDAEQLMAPLLKKCSLAMRFVEIQHSQMLALRDEIDRCSSQLPEMQQKQISVALPSTINLKDVFEKIRVSDISHLSGYSAKLASLAVFSEADSSILKSLQGLACHIDALKFSMTLFKQEVSDFMSLCGQYFPTACAELHSSVQYVERMWTRMQSDYAICKKVLLDRNCNILFSFLIEETLAVVRKMKSQNFIDDTLSERDRLNLKLCSGVINFIHNAFKEEIVTRSELYAKYNEVLLVEWEELNKKIQASDIMAGPMSVELTPLASLLSPFSDRRVFSCSDAPEFLRRLNLRKEPSSMTQEVSDTPDTTPRNTPIEGTKSIHSQTPEKLVPESSLSRVLGLGLNLGLEFGQSSAVPLSVVKKDRILSLNIHPSLEKGTNLTEKFEKLHMTGPTEPLPQLRSPADLRKTSRAKSQIPRMVDNYDPNKFPKINQMDACGSKIPMISRTHPLFVGIQIPKRRARIPSQDFSVLYTNLRTPPGFNLSAADTSTPRVQVRNSPTNASYCLGLMTPNNTLGSVAERYSPEVLDWGSRPLLRRRNASTLSTPAPKYTKKPWK